MYKHMITTISLAATLINTALIYTMEQDNPVTHEQGRKTRAKEAQERSNERILKRAKRKSKKAQMARQKIINKLRKECKTYNFDEKERNLCAELQEVETFKEFNKDAINLFSFILKQVSSFYCNSHFSASGFLFACSVPITSFLPRNEMSFSINTIAETVKIAHKVKAPLVLNALAIDIMKFNETENLFSCLDQENGLLFARRMIRLSLYQPFKKLGDKAVTYIKKIFGQNSQIYTPTRADLIEDGIISYTRESCDCMQLDNNVFQNQLILAYREESLYFTLNAGSHLLLQGLPTDSPIKVFLAHNVSFDESKLALLEEEILDTLCHYSVLNKKEIMTVLNSYGLLDTKQNEKGHITYRFNGLNEAVVGILKELATYIKEDLFSATYTLTKNICNKIEKNILNSSNIANLELVIEVLADLQIPLLLNAFASIESLNLETESIKTILQKRRTRQRFYKASNSLKVTAEPLISLTQLVEDGIIHIPQKLCSLYCLGESYHDQVKCSLRITIESLVENCTNQTFIHPDKIPASLLEKLWQIFKNRYEKNTALEKALTGIQREYKKNHSL